MKIKGMENEVPVRKKINNCYLFLESTFRLGGESMKVSCPSFIPKAACE
jgi:hypothetical protein